MSDTIIRVENLSKKYQLSHARAERYTALRDVISDRARQLKSNMLGSRKQQPSNKEDFWALKDVSFEIKRGDRIGIIGRNGAGKSTLLKVLSRITEPTQGSIEMRGKVSSLLEVGTGFHPELTGRENIFLNGAILGMGKTEIRRKFDEIVSFAEVEKFLDIPVKRYSSGMYVRLAFAVAAHLEPEILIVDEVLAVGDYQFQKKCLGKMKDVSRTGRTIVFVSHDTSAVNALCNKAFLLKEGRILTSGNCDEVISQYVHSQSIGRSLDAHLDLKNCPERVNDSPALLQEADIFCDNEHGLVLSMGGELKIIARFKSEDTIAYPRFGISIESITGQRVVNFSPSHQCPDLFPHKIKEGIITCTVPELRLVPGTYYVSLILADAVSDIDRINQAFKVSVEPIDVFGTGQVPSSRHGIFYADAAWHLEVS